VTDYDVENLELGRAALMFDVQRVARVVADRYLKSDIALTWSMLREIEEETLCDISLLGRWPVEDLMELVERSQIPPNEGEISPEWARRLTALPAFVYSMFEQRCASSRDAAIAEM
jgi:hypothetical protein